MTGWGGLAMLGAVLLASPQESSLQGPARFCGYSPIIDLLPGETITVLEGGIHAGRFRWEGAFGTLDVFGVGWASRPPGRIVTQATEARPARFAQSREGDATVVALWNGAHAAAYFRSSSRMTPAKIRAIERVVLFEEGQTPDGCDLRTVFDWP